MFFGWDEQNKYFVNTDVERIEQQVLQLIDNYITPKIQIIPHKILQFGIISILFVIPRDGYIHTVDTNVYIREGSHRKKLTVQESDRLKINIMAKETGFICIKVLQNHYLEHYLKLQESYLAYITLFQFKTFLQVNHNELINLPSQWEIDIKPWKLSLPLNSFIKIELKGWKAQQNTLLITETISLIEKTVETLSKDPFIVH